MDFNLKQYSNLLTILKQAGFFESFGRFIENLLVGGEVKKFTTDYTDSHRLKKDNVCKENSPQGKCTTDFTDSHRLKKRNMCKS
ncbi:MAG: hypothetical protein AB9846_06165 [Tenuifilaceae bacterium]